MLPSWLTSRLAAVNADGSVPLEERWRWALERAQANRPAGGHWTAFSIRRELGPHAHAGTTDINLLFYVRALASALAGESAEPTHDLFFFFGFGPGAARDEDLRQVLVSNRPQTLALGRRPLIWLGRAPEEQSVPLLMRLYRRLYPREPSDSLIVAAAAHTRPEALTEVAAVLEEIAFGDWRPSVQREAVDALCRLPFDVGADSVRRLAREHPSRAVREEAGDSLRQGRRGHAAGN